MQQSSETLAPVILGIQLLSFVTALVNSNSSSPMYWHGDLDAIRLLSPSTHHLLSMPRLPEEKIRSSNSGLLIEREIFRLASLILLAQLKKRFAFGDGPGIQILAAQLRNILLRRDEWTPIAPELLIWALVVATLPLSGQLKVVFVDEICRAMKDMHSHKLDAIGIAKQVLWIHDLHSEQVERLAEDIGHKLCTDYYQPTLIDMKENHSTDARSGINASCCPFSMSLSCHLVRLTPCDSSAHSNYLSRDPTRFLTDK